MMNGKIIIGGVVVLLCLIGGILLWQKISEPTQLPAQPTKELKLSDFPEAFKEKTVIVLGDNASEIERQAAEEIKNFLLEHNSSYIKIIDSQKIESFKRGYNMIIIGTPKTNPLLEEVYAMTNATRVTEEFPGEGRGVLEILRNPWDESKAMLLVEGWDERGAKSGSEMFRFLQDIDETSVFVKWNGVNTVFSRLIPSDKYIFVEFLQEIKGAPIMIDRPVIYHFNNTSGVLEGGSFAINNDLVIVIGNRLVVKEPGGGGAGGVIPVYTLPSTINTPFSWKIIYLDADGTVYLRYKNTKVALKPGEIYEKRFITEWMGYKVEYIVRIKNYGLQDKNKIKLWRV